MEIKKELFGEPLWLFYCLFGKDYINECIENNLSIEELFENSRFKWFIATSPKGNRIIYPDMKPFFIKEDQIQKISAFEAYKLVGLTVMEDAMERTYSIIID